MPDSNAAGDPREIVRPLIHTRQYREFTTEPVDEPRLEAIADVGRWTGSSQNTQPWRFIVLRDESTLRKIAEAGVPQTRSLRTATAAIAIAMPNDPKRDVSYAYDEARAAERMLVAASMLGLGAGIAWIRSDVRELMGTLLGLPEDRFVRTILALGHPTPAARAPKSTPGTARRPRNEVVFDDRWHSGPAVARS
jgi:nitroreductase